MIDIQEIMKRLPHRYPFLLVDRVLEVSENHIKAIKNVSINEPFFQGGHFPGYPVMPGVLIVEAMAQCAGIHAFETTEDVPDDVLFFFMGGVDGVKFRKQVVPGDQLEMTVTLIKKEEKYSKSKRGGSICGWTARM